MKKKTDSDKRKRDQNIQDHKKRAKADAIATVKSWSEQVLKDYEEPSRAGTPKGDPVGLSRKKLYAAHLNLLYPHCLQLKEIAKMAGISPNVLHVWRQNENFIKAVKGFGEVLGGSIVSWIDMYIKISEKEPDQTLKIDNLKSDDIDNLSGIESAEALLKLNNLEPVDEIIRAVSILPFLSSSAAEPFFAKYLREKIDSTSGSTAIRYIALAERAIREAFVHDAESFREWERRPEVLEMTKTMIESDIDDLMICARDGGKDEWERTQKFADSVKKHIIDKLDILAQ